MGNRAKIKRLDPEKIAQAAGWTVQGASAVVARAQDAHCRRHHHEVSQCLIAAQAVLRNLKERQDEQPEQLDLLEALGGN